MSTSSSDYHVIAGSESSLDPEILSREFLCDKYIDFRKDRKFSNVNAIKGGGVFIAVLNTIQCEDVRIPEMADLEAICVKIKTRTGFVYIYCL